MPKVKHPSKEFWETDKKPAYLEISKRKKCGDSFTDNIKFRRLSKKGNKK